MVLDVIPVVLENRSEKWNASFGSEKPVEVGISAPHELELSELLKEYKEASKAKKVGGGYVFSKLQHRLLSSIKA